MKVLDFAFNCQIYQVWKTCVYLAVLSFAFFGGQVAQSQENAPDQQHVAPSDTAPVLSRNSDESPSVVPNYWDFRSIGTPPSAEDLGSIRVLMSDDFPPFSYVTRDNRLAGFHVDFTKAICQELKVTCTILVRPFNQLVTVLNEGKGDAVMAGLSIQSASQQGLLLSDVYLTTPGRFVRRKSAGDLDQLLAQKIGVVAGTTHERFLRDFYRDTELELFGSRFAARRAARNGDIDALFGDGLSLSFWLNGEKSESCCEFVGGPYMEPNYFGDGFAIAMPATRAGLQQGFNYAIREVFKNGIFAELYLRYFPISFF